MYLKTLEICALKICEIYELDLVRFLIAPGLAFQAAFKKTKVKLDTLTNTDMLLMVEKNIRGGKCLAIYR